MPYLRPAEGGAFGLLPPVRLPGVTHPPEPAPATAPPLAGAPVYQAFEATATPPPRRCYEDGSCDPVHPGTSTVITPTTPAPATSPGGGSVSPEYGRDQLMAQMDYGRQQRYPSTNEEQLRGLFGGGA